MSADNQVVAESALKWFIHEVHELLSSAADPNAVQTNPFERFAVPYQFHPRLTWGGAAIAVIMGIVRIVLASLLFAVWGTCIWMAWGGIHNWILRGAVVLSLIGGFFVTLALLMIGLCVCESRIRTFTHRPH